MEKNYKVYDVKSDTEVKVSAEWLDGVELNGIESIEFTKGSGMDCLKVSYANGELICYYNIYGSWGNPTEIK
jgi:hypothetical protein